MTTEVTASAEAPPSEPAPPVAEPPTEQGVGDPNLGQNGSVVDGDPPAVTHDGVVWPGAGDTSSADNAIRDASAAAAAMYSHASRLEAQHTLIERAMCTL